jgi:hypothetical protein
MMIINLQKLLTPRWILIIYMLFCGLFIMIFRFIFPGSEPPLLIYFRDWRLVKGFLEFFNLFPALAFSALVIPYGLASSDDNNLSLADLFFKRLLVSVVTAIGVAVVYCIIFFFALPMVKNYEEDMRFRGEMYQLAKDFAHERRNTGEWLDASQFLQICDVIWPNSPELAELRIDIEINLQRIRTEEHEYRAYARAALAREFRSANYRTLSGNLQPVNAADAISLSEAAFSNNRYYDAHWLATLGSRLAIPGSPEAANSAQLASEAWNMITSLAPNHREVRLFELFNIKLSGYQAMNSGDWIRAYYIFRSLLEYTPDDPDVANFLAASEIGAMEIAFFIDEIEYSLGEILTGALFSLPSQNGRAVVRFSSLTTFDDVAYGMGFEYMAFDINSRPLVSVSSPYAKILPFSINENSQLLVLTHALDRYNEDNNIEGEWLLGNRSPGGILLDISFEELLVLSHVRRGLPNLQINELLAASQRLGFSGYVPEIFEAEILNRLGSALFFLPMAIFVIIIAWRYRARTRPRYLFIIMLPVMPIVFNGFVFIYRSVLNTLGIWLTLSLGFAPALIVYIIFLVLALFISMVSLAAQHNR